MYYFNMASGPARQKLEIKRSPPPEKKTLENMCPLPEAAGCISVANGPHNVHLCHIKPQEHYYNDEISFIRATRRLKVNTQIIFRKPVFYSLHSIG